MIKIKYWSWRALVAVLFLAIGFASCKDDDDLSGDLPYLFRPINFSADVTSTDVVISWAAVDSAVSYYLEIHQDSLEFNNLVDSVTTTETSAAVQLSGGTRYSARVRANASDTTENSKFNATLTFKTPSENLFKGYTTEMTAQSTVTANWLAGKTVTYLIFVPTDGTDSISYEISDDELTAGSKICEDVPNNEYTLKIYNGTTLRGSVDVTVEGDFFLQAGDDLTSTLDEAKDDDVIVLASGELFETGTATYSFSKSVKIRGISSNTLAVIAMSPGASSGSNMFGIGSNAELDHLTFENVKIVGYTSNDSESGTKIAYCFNNGNACTVQSILFSNCVLSHYGNTPFRLKGGNATIDSLIFDNCIIADAGSSSYAVINSNKSGDVINNIRFTDCTVYNFARSLILYQNSSCKQVVIENCTFNQMMTDASSSRYFIDYNSSTISDGIYITASILGSTGGATAAGIRTGNDELPLTVSGSYYTTDYIDTGGGSIISYLTAYDGASTDLWSDPENGDFTIIDTGFAGLNTAGDSRW